MFPESLKGEEATQGCQHSTSHPPHPVTRRGTRKAALSPYLRTSTTTPATRGSLFGGLAAVGRPHFWVH